MTDQDWQAGFAKSLGVFLNGQAISDGTQHGEPIVDDSFCVLFNAHYEADGVRPAGVEVGRAVDDCAGHQRRATPSSSTQSAGSAAPASASTAPAGHSLPAPAPTKLQPDPA